MSEVTRWSFNSFDLGYHFCSPNKFEAMQPTIITMVEASDYDALTTRYRHVLNVMRRDGYWSGLMTDAEVDAQVDEDIARGEP